MASSAKQFNDPFDSLYTPLSGQIGLSASTKPGDGTHLTGSSIWEQIATKLGLEPDHKAEYERALDLDDKAYERASVMSARAFEEYMESTRYQRAFKDIEAAGGNPWLLLQNGGVSAAGSNYVPEGGSARNRSHKPEKASIFKDAALTLLATAKILSII